MESTSPEIIWGLGGPEEDHQLHHCCWTGRVSEREEEGSIVQFTQYYKYSHSKMFPTRPSMLTYVQLLNETSRNVHIKLLSFYLKVFKLRAYQLV